MLDIFLLIGIIILQILDGMTTYEALTNKGAVEANFLLRWFMDKVGIIPALVVTKTVFIGILVAACLFYPSIYLTIVLTLVMCLYVWVVVNNLRVGG